LQAIHAATSSEREPGARLLRPAALAALVAGGACLAGAVVVVAAARAAGTANGSPLIPPGHWRSALVTAVIVWFGAYVAGLVLLARSPGRVRTVAGLAVAVQLVPLAAPLLLSTDVASYGTYGRAAQPYIRQDGWATASVYGPLWTMVSAPLSRIGTGTYAFRTVAALSALALIALTWRLTTRKALAVAFVGWNPLVALHSAGGGHNDTLMMALVLGAILLARTGRPQLAGASWAASVAVKWASAQLYVLWAIQERRRRNPIGLPGLVGTGAAIVVAAFALYGVGWLHVFTTLSEEGRRRASLGLLGWLDDLGVTHRPALVLIAVLQLAAFAAFAVQAWRGRLRLGLAAGVLALLTARLNPWYGIWGVSLAAADDDDRWGRLLAIGMTGLLLSDAVSTVANA
jgi:hypothetical protein